MADAATYGAPAVAGRCRLSDVLRDAERPLGIPASAVATGARPNAVRFFHLNVLAPAVCDEEHRAQQRGSRAQVLLGSWFVGRSHRAASHRSSP